MNIVMAFLIAATVSLQTVKLGTAPGKTMVVTGATVSAHAEITNTVTKAYVEALGIEAGISAPTATNIAEGVVREGVRTNYLCTVAAAQAKADAAEAAAKAASRPVTWMPTANQVGAIPDNGSVAIKAPYFKIGEGRIIRGDIDPDTGASEIVFETPGTYGYSASALVPDDSYVATINMVNQMLPTASSLRAVTYAADAPNDHKTASGILSVAGRATDTKIANAVTTYTPTNALVALNQSVQYVVANGTALEILTPPSVANGCRDWLVYVNATADTPLNLTHLGGILVADAAYTNACAANKVTMLCFTEMTNGVYVIGRQELTAVK